MLTPSTSCQELQELTLLGLRPDRLLDNSGAGFDHTSEATDIHFRMPCRQVSSGGAELHARVGTSVSRVFLPPTMRQAFCRPTNEERPASITLALNTQLLARVLPIRPGHPVADAGDVADPGGVLGVVAELAAQLPYERTDGLGVACRNRVVSPPPRARRTTQPSVCGSSVVPRRGCGTASGGPRHARLGGGTGPRLRAA